LKVTRVAVVGERQAPYVTAMVTPAQLSPEATPQPVQVQPAPEEVAPVYQLPDVPWDVKPSGQGWEPEVRTQSFCADGAHVPPVQDVAPEGKGQNASDDCQATLGDVAPVAWQLSQVPPD
jgi:hypothetical protein